MITSFKNIPFHPIFSTQKIEWNFETHEYITATQPTTVSYNRKPEIKTARGYLLGSGAKNLRDMLIQSVSKEPNGLLIHPDFGFKNVCCVSLKISQSVESIDSFQIEFNFFETNEKPESFLSDEIGLIDKANQSLNDWGADFLKVLQPLITSAYALDRLAYTLEKIDNFITSNSGIGIFKDVIDSYGDSANQMRNSLKDIIISPKKLEKSLKKSFLNAAKPLKLANFIGGMGQSNIVGDVNHKLQVLCVLSDFLKQKDDTDAEKLSKEEAEDKKKIVIAISENELEPHVYMLLKSIARTYKSSREPMPKSFGGLPSLVASYNYFGSFIYDEKIAESKGQPFNV